MLRCLIVGGGLQGTHLARVLTSPGGIGADDLRVLDPHARPLALWRRLTRQCAMPYLRSPHTHNIDIPIMSLRRYWAARSDKAPRSFIDPYLRPALNLFNDHCDNVINTHGLGDLRIQGRAVRISSIRGGLRVDMGGDYLDARKLVLALGRSEHPFWPAWARTLRENGGRVCHIYDAHTDPGGLRKDGETVVVGGGISAASLVRFLVDNGHPRVWLLSRRPLRTDNLDFDPCWAGPKCIGPFEKTAYGRRRAIVDRARRRGTITQEAAQALSERIRSGRVVIADSVDFSSTSASGRIHFRTAAGDVIADQVVLATGFEPGPPGGAFLAQLIRDLRLPITACGYPRLTPDLRWHDRIRVMGPLAELAMGPAAGNIIGGRLAARRILVGITLGGCRAAENTSAG